MMVKMRFIAIAAAVISGVAASENLAASCSTETVIYAAAGRFGSLPIKGQDPFKLAGETFTLNVYVCESLQPSQTGSDDAIYSGVTLTGTVRSALITTRYTIRPTPMTFTLVQPPTGPDLLKVAGNLSVFGSLISIHGSIALPANTLANTSIAPFPSVSIVTADSAFTYSYSSWRPATTYSLGQEIVDPSGNAQKVQTPGTSATTAPAWNETLNGTTTDGTVLWSCEGPYTPNELSIRGSASATASPGSGAEVEVLLHADSIQVIIAHADGTQSARPLREAPVDLSASSDKVMLQFYASGVRDASEVHVQIAGQDLPVLYSGASDIPGLDQILVELPATLARMGQVDVVLTANGRAASPVPLHIQ